MSLAALLRDRRYYGLFWTQLLGALNDNLVKAAALLLVMKLAGGAEGAALVALGSAVFMAPFFLFSALAGELADGLVKARIARMTKVAEIVIMIFGAMAFVAGSPVLLLATLFMMGTQSAIFGPVKYSILPELLAAGELLPANALIEASTFLAILLGTIAGSLLILAPSGAMLVAGCSLLVAVAGWLASRTIPTGTAAGELALRNPLAGIADLWRVARDDRGLWRAIAGISWIWAIAGVYLALFPPLVAEQLRTDEVLVSVMLGLFALGVGCGSILANRLTVGRIDLMPVPFAALAMALASLDLGFAAWSLAGAPGRPLEVILLDPQAWRLLADGFVLALAGGVFMVPLYAWLQHQARPEARARTIAALNIVSAFWTMAASLAVSAVFALDARTGDVLAGFTGSTLLTVFLVLGLINLTGVALVWRILPSHVLKAILRIVLRLLYRVEVRGLEHAMAAGDGALYVVNHVSLLDGPLMMAFLPGLPAFAVATDQAERWWIRPFRRIAGLIPIDPTRPLAAKTIIELLRAGRSCVIFPEGRVTVTGSLMKVYDGAAHIAARSGAPLVPVRIDGAERTRLSYLRHGEVRRRLFPKIVLTVLPERKLPVPEGLKGRAQRAAASRALYDMMADLMCRTTWLGDTLWDALLLARNRCGGGTPALEDPQTRLSYNGLVRAAMAIGAALEGRLGERRDVGVLLPTSVGAAVTLFGLTAGGRVPAMLNFTTGRAAFHSALRAVRIERIISSRRFVEMAALEGLLADLPDGVEMVWLEDVKESIGLGAKLGAWLADVLRERPRPARTADAPAVVLFTSGSEGAPKGVVLSHGNLLANVAQASACIDATARDKVFNALPVFHSFGLTGGLLLPVLSGTPAFLYPSPLHYKIVPELVYQSNATILFGTDTFLRGYARTASPYDFRSLRYVFAGAEAVQPATRAVWLERFGVRLLEGYGATETSPLLAVNTPLFNRSGTVGRLMPMIEARLEPVDGIAEGGQLFVRGPNVMLGYLRVERPGELQPLADGWYDTGDIVTIDAEGFVRILDRAGRFAKVGGEKISLTAVEALAAEVWPDARHAAITLPDARKGERIVLVSEAAPGGLERLRSHAGAKGVGEIMLPAELREQTIPLLGSGKTDRSTLKRSLLAEESKPAA